MTDPLSANREVESDIDALTTDDLRALVDSARALADELEFTGLLDRILEQATRLTDSPDASILLFDRPRNRLYFAAAKGPNAPAVLERWGIDSPQGVPLNGSKAGEVFTTGRSFVLEAMADDAKHFRGVDIDTRHSTDSMVCVPLSASGQRLGVVQLLNKRTGPYSPRDVLLLEHFSSQAAVAIRNVHLFEDLLAHMGLYGSRRSGVGPAELLEELNAPPRYEQVTVVFADMRGFTRLSQILDRPERTFDYLNQFLALLTTSVLDHEGLVNKFLGDGIMAIFRGLDHSTRAVNCAFDILEGFDRLRQVWDDSSNTPLRFLDVGIGMATDSVLLGSLGTERVRDFTAIGLSVALAAYLQEHARDGRRIVVDKRTFRLALAVIPQHEGPLAVELRSPGQAVGQPFECYSISSSTTVAPSAALPARPSQPGAPSPEVFISYSHHDSVWLARLRTHLKPYLRKEGAISIWDDTRIRAGQEWRSEIERALAGAKVAVLLVTPNFLDSDFIADSELPPLLDAAEQGGLKILWLPVSASAYRQTKIADYQALSNPTKPLDGLNEAERNRVLVTVAEEIASALR